MALVEMDFAAGIGGGEITAVEYKTNISDYTFTINNLIAGKKYLFVKFACSSVSSYVGQRLNLQNVTGGTVDTIIPVVTYSSNPYLGYVAYILTPTSTSVSITTQDYSSSDAYMLFDIE